MLLTFPCAGRLRRKSRASTKKGLVRYPAQGPGPISFLLALLGLIRPRPCPQGDAVLVTQFQDLTALFHLACDENVLTHTRGLYALDLHLVTRRDLHILALNVPRWPEMHDQDLFPRVQLEADARPHPLHGSDLLNGDDLPAHGPPPGRGGRLR